MKKLNIVLIFVISVLVGAMSTQAKRYRANLQLTDYKNQILFLQKNLIDIAGVNYNQKNIQVLVSESQLEFLKANGFEPDLVIRLEIVDQEYKTPVEIASILKDYNSRYPNITNLVSIGKSLEGRDIWALNISDNANTIEVGEPAILFNGMHHAREVMTPEVPLDIIENLLSEYGHNEKLTNWVNAYSIWVVPMLNVDGNNKVWNEDVWWRKNTRNGHGVDINRNYPFSWGSCEGSSGSKNSDTYRGESPGSEPETQALMSLVEKVRPVFDISFHSYGELVLYPYGCEGKRVETAAVVEPLGQEMASLIDYTPGVPWEILYGVDGDDISWMYHDFQVIPYVIELNQDFQPNYAKTRDITVKKLRAAWNLLFERLSGPSLTGRILDSRGLKGTDVILKISGNGVNQDYRVNPDGTFHVILNPGEYNLVVQTPEKIYERDVIKIQTSPLRKDIELK